MDTDQISLAVCSAGALLSLHRLCEQQGESRICNALELREHIGYGGLSCIIEKYAPDDSEEGAIFYFNRLYKEIGFAMDNYDELIPGWSLFNQGNVLKV